MKPYIFYRLSDGFILRKILTDDDDTPIPNAGEGYIESASNIDDSYVDITVNPAVVVAKSVFPDGVLAGGYFTVNVPVGTTAIWQGQRYQVDDGVLEVLINEAGVFPLTLYHPKYIVREYEIEN